MKVQIGLKTYSLVPGNVGGGLNLMKQNNYGLNTTGLQNTSPNNDFGFPHLTFPNNHYDYTPFDAIWAHGNNINTTNYDDNTMHVEDPTPHIGQFLTEEIAPTTLYLSNRTIKGEQYTCSGNLISEKYYADFEARNSVLAGNQSIYQHNIVPYARVRTKEGDFVVDDGAVVTLRANNYNGQSAVTLGAGFSAKAGSIFRAYVFTDPDMCDPSGSRLLQTNISSPKTQSLTRPIISSKKAVSNNLVATDNSQTASIRLYPNPSCGAVCFSINRAIQFNYILRDIAGKTLMQGDLSALNGRIDLSQLARGVYFISIESETIKQTNRIILQW